MKEKFAKIFESNIYGQLLITKSSLKKDKEDLLKVYINFTRGKVITTIAIKPSRNSVEGMGELFTNLSLKDCEEYIVEECGVINTKKINNSNVHYIQK